MNEADLFRTAVDDGTSSNDNNNQTKKRPLTFNATLVGHEDVARLARHFFAIDQAGPDLSTLFSGKPGHLPLTTVQKSGLTYESGVNSLEKTFLATVANLILVQSV